ncbi:hypothetical protein NE865_02676 [Phthorimaea operculella]|nr:hypothetical protein NE865_02676 [Phthorimaea operculella]
MLWLRVKHLRLEAAKLQTLDVTSDEKIKKIKKIMVTFKHLFDNLNKDRKSLKFQVFVVVMMDFFRTTLNLYLGINAAFAELPKLIRIMTLTTMSLEEFRLVLVLAIPLLAAELVLHETDQLKLALVDCLLKDNGSCRPYLLETLELVEEHPLQLVVCGVRLDVNLLLTFLSICVTYIFVLLQFRYT